MTDLRPADVLFGRGSGPNDHEGNVRFRHYVGERKVSYMATNHRMTKTKIAREIVTLVQQNNGRFLRKLENAQKIKSLGLLENGDYYEIVDDHTIMEKAKQALRQNAAKVRGEQMDAAKSPKSTTSSHSSQLQQPIPPPSQIQTQMYFPSSGELSLEPLPISSPSASFVNPHLYQQQHMAMTTPDPDPILYGNRVVSGPSSQTQTFRQDQFQVLYQQSAAAAGMAADPVPVQNLQGVTSSLPVSSQSHPTAPTGTYNMHAPARRYDNKRQSLTVKDLEAKRDDDVGELTDSFNQMKTDDGTRRFSSATMTSAHRNLMTSTETMGTIENIGSVTDMSLGSVGGFSQVFGKGNDSYAMEDTTEKNVVSNSQGVAYSLTSSSLMGNSTPSSTPKNAPINKNPSFEGNTSLNITDIHCTEPQPRTFSSSLSGSVSGVNESRKQVDGDVNSANLPSIMPRTVAIMEEEPEEFDPTTMGPSSMSVLKAIDDEPDQNANDRTYEQRRDAFLQQQDPSYKET